MHTPKDYDYDLWTVKENEKTRYFVRIKRTGEETEIDHETMCFLRKEEKKLRRMFQEQDTEGAVLSLDMSFDDEKEYWFSDHNAAENKMITNIEIREFCKVLTSWQREIFECCILQGWSMREFARKKEVDHKVVVVSMKAIRKKYQKYFSGTSPKR